MKSKFCLSNPILCNFSFSSGICVSCIFKKKGETKKIHNIIFIPSFQTGERVNRVLERYGDLNTDGRPILQIDCEEFMKILLDIDENIFVVPAHIWTPHFSLFGSNSGFDRIEDCFGKYTDEIFALETGLSSDPEMNWALSSLDRFTLISNSDAHSPQKLGREANVFAKEFDFGELKEILKEKNKNLLNFTVEYFPEEWKYHYDGHRNCKVCLSPVESENLNNICPVCRKKVTIGVMHRVMKLANRKLGQKPPDFIPFKKIVPLGQIIGYILGKSEESPAVKSVYMEIINKFGNEFSILFQVPEEEMEGKIDRKILKGISNMRKKKVKISPGYDGEFGKVEIEINDDNTECQESLF